MLLALRYHFVVALGFIVVSDALALHVINAEVDDIDVAGWNPELSTGSEGGVLVTGLEGRKTKATKPVTVKTKATKPATVKAKATKPVTVKAKATKPATVKTKATKPATVKTQPTKPIAAKTKATKLTTVKTKSTKAAATPKSTQSSVAGVSISFNA
jgi:hypothetical protein